MANRMTMKMIAEELGLSRWTVSSIVNKHHIRDGIPDETAQRVLKYMHEKRYVPSRQAVQLKKGQTDTVGIIHTGRLLGHEIDAYNQLINVLVEKQRPMEIKVLYDSNFRNGFLDLLGRGITSLVMITHIYRYDQFKYYDLFDYLDGINTVMYNFVFDERNAQAEKDFLSRGFHLVGIDRRLSCAQAAKALKEMGHDTIAFPHSFVDSKDQKPIGAVQGFLDHGFRTTSYEYGSEQIFKKTPQENIRLCAEGIAAAIREQQVTVAFADITIAAYVIDELMKIGLRVPEDVSIISFDSLGPNSFLGIKLSAISFPVRQMIQRVEDILFGRETSGRNCFTADFIPSKSHGPVSHCRALEVYP